MSGDPRPTRPPSSPANRAEGTGERRPAPPDTADAPYSIGRLARETGIAAATLRVWERRYGNPLPRRLPSGHRRYDENHVRQLRKVAEGLARGLRPGVLLRLGEAELDRRLQAQLRPLASAPRQAWLAPLLALDRAGLEALLVENARGKPLEEFLDGFLCVFLAEVGRAWAEGELDVRHEHFASAVIADHLRALRADAARRARRPYRATLVLATLPGEEHGLALEMIALVAERARLQPARLGTDVPIDEIARAVRELRAELVAISVSLAGGGPATDRELARLQEALPRGVTLLVGGAGARRGRRRGPRGCALFDDLGSLSAWMADFVPAGGPSGGSEAGGSGRAEEAG